MNRPSKDSYYMEIAKVVAKRSTCYRRQVGCVLINSYGHIIATGYNGVAKGQLHCIDGYSSMCSGALLPSGIGLDKCKAIHAEQNALLQCGNVQTITTCYTLTKPCTHCFKLLMNTSCNRIVYVEEYPHDLLNYGWAGVIERLEA